MFNIQRSKNVGELRRGKSVAITVRFNGANVDSCEAVGKSATLGNSFVDTDCTYLAWLCAAKHKANAI